MNNTEKDSRKISLQIDINQAKYQIEEAKKSLSDNESFMNYIEGFGLMVKDGNKKISVDRTTICYYDNTQDLIKARISMLKDKIQAYQEELNEL